MKQPNTASNSMRHEVFSFHRALMDFIKDVTYVTMSISIQQGAFIQLVIGRVQTIKYGNQVLYKNRRWVRNRIILIMIEQFCSVKPIHILKMLFTSQKEKHLASRKLNNYNFSHSFKECHIVHLSLLKHEGYEFSIQYFN